MSDIENMKKLAGIAPTKDLQEAFANTPAETSHPDPTEHGDIRDWGENIDTSLRRYLDSQLASPEMPQPVTEDEMVKRYKDFLNETVYNEQTLAEAKCGCCNESPCGCDSDCSCKTNESVEETVEEIDETVEEVEEETVEENDDMFARILQLAGVHKVTEDDINQPEAVEESEEVEEEIVDESDEIEEQAIEEDVVDEETIEEEEQSVSESDSADLDWLKNIIKY